MTTEKNTTGEDLLKIQQATELYLKMSAPYIKILADMQVFKIQSYIFDFESNTMTPINNDTETEISIKNTLNHIHFECYKDLL